MRKFVTDNRLGRLAFPLSDSVVSAAIDETGEWEPLVREWLTENVSQGDLCLNVGAHVGYFTLHMSNLVGVSGTVIAVEPRRDLVRLLRANVKMGRKRNVEVHRIAATSEEGQIGLYLNPRNTGDNRVFDPRVTVEGGNYTDHGFDRIPTAKKVAGLTMDRILRARVPDVCLLDTQGWEHHVIRGMRETLGKSRPKMLVEFVPQWLSDLGENPVGILQEYSNFGYSLSVLEDLSREIMSPKEIVDWVSDSESYFCDIILE